MNEQQKAEALRFYHAGVRVESIHKLLGGVTDGQVKRYIYKIMKLSSRNMKHTTGVISEIRRLRKEGKLGKEIELITGLTRSQIRYLFEQVGTSYKKIDYSNQKV